MTKRKRSLEFAGSFENTVPVDNTKVVTPIVNNQKVTSFFRPNDAYLYDGVFTDADAIPYRLIEKGGFKFDKQYLTKQEIDDFVRAKQNKNIADMFRRITR